MNKINVNASRKSNGAGMHDQILHFVGGTKRLIQGVMYVWENEMTHIVDYLGIEYIVNKNNLLFVERFSRGGEGYERTDRPRVKRGRTPRIAGIQNSGERGGEKA